MNFKKYLKIYSILCLTILFFECKKSNSNYQQEHALSNYEEDGYPDGTYCAEIDYYYSETGTSSTYTLLVEIENNELTEIHWPNGGWLDNSHFTPPDISSGEASFTSDRGVDYTIKIIGNDGDCSTTTYVTNEDDLIQQKEDNEDKEDEYQKKQSVEEEEQKAEEEQKRRQQEEEQAQEENQE
ncbi:hypothetical protein GKZ90_0014725 [Flavobacterium sp. MC2016-06]|jgi:hypothetical protein|uniref:hypothetical protein n=1 Tax=Flavobacterium sp. MC2016-06 TaxID=2676308 RepID=UPI0012BB18A4|nr:hypothetical protein [Flavobacterium sp. MC2016-06]MBU3859274.1 hypothetical protein [Flavobacterium sp. MC2016-06]